jgi:putative peptide zinc metalloprotease protein
VAEQLLSATWYRVAGLRPRLRSHVRIRRHEYRGKRWYVVEDRISRRTHRFNPAAHFIIGLMNGRRSMQQIWDAAVARLGDEVPTQDEVIQLLGQLHNADVMQCEVAPDIDDLLRRAHRTTLRTQLQRWMMPLAIRIPLVDPDRLLERWLPWYRAIFGPLGAIAWLIVVGWGLFLAIQNWDDLTHDITHRVLAPENLLIMGLVFPVLKALHEFGHACAVKAWGGEVHEMGIMLLVLMPIPYVDASSANTFPEKRRRVVVGAAGMVVELFLAAIALFLWLEMEPGLLRAVLFNVILIASISTVLFNANPLLRFDGYYILADLLEIPNLRQRAMQHLQAFFQRWLFGIEPPRSDASHRERFWLVFFAISAFLYRIFITLVIAVFVASEYLFIGVVLALWAIGFGVVMPLAGLFYYVVASPRLRQRRLRAVVSAGAVCLALYALVFLLPVPSWTNAQGVVWPPDQAALRIGTDGFIQRVVAEPGSRVERGQPLIESADPALVARIRVLEAQRAELTARYHSELIDRLVHAQVTLEQLKIVNADLARTRERAGELTVRSPLDGVFTMPAAQDLPGRFLRQGDKVGYVIPDATLTARVVVPQRSADLVRARTERVLVKAIERMEETISARIVREVPAASDRLPSMVLSHLGGGEVALGQGPGGDARTLQTHFEFEVELSAASLAGLGERVYVRFEHGNETVAEQLWRSVRQMFLRRFTV